MIERDTHDVPVLEVAGEVDLRVAPELGERLSHQLSSSTSPVVVLDLQAVTFLGVAGLSVLITAHRRARLQHTSLRIVANTATVCRSLKVAAQHQPLEVYPKLTAAAAV
ncbi:STAS domain-containing protein [Amycolatopsis marina]|uniref:STAS domain-containing protein n=1 Tax=Amycolatopsis marina TaxID=490629 RepID=UPI0015A65734|nr:STAS domain-containing protein [Amycolatopsis marina]